MAAVQGPVESAEAGVESRSEEGAASSAPGPSSDAQAEATATVEALASNPTSHPLRDIAKAFRIAKDSLDASGGTSLDLKLFTSACESMNVLFSILGVAFAFAGRDYVDKVKDLRRACDEFVTAEDMLAKDMSAKTVKVRGSHARNLLRVIRGLDLNKRLFEYLEQDSTQSLRAVAGRAYEEVFSKHHSWAIRSLVAAGLLALPSAPQFLGYLHEDEQTCREPADEFVSCVEPVIKHVEGMFEAKGLGIDW